MPTAALVSLATSAPPHVFLQKDVLAAAWDELGPRFPEFATFSSIFANTGIVKRHGVRPFEWYLKPRGWPERTQAFLEGAEALFVDVAQKALASAHLGGGDIDTVVTVCSTGIATPSLEARVARAMGFRSDVMRVPVFGLGCAGGVSGLSIASRLAQARPGTNVLLVAIELCSLALRHDELTKANIVAVSLFGDGAAAIILRAGDGGATRIEDAGEHLADAAFDGGHRPLHLPSRRRPGHHRAGGGIFTQSRHARSRTADHRRLWQHVGTHGVVRARTRAREGTAGKVAVDGARTRLHRKLRHAAARHVTSAEFILGLVTLQRAGELVLSRYNTHRLLARGAVEIAPRHYLLIVAVHAAWLISLWVFGHDQPVNVFCRNNPWCRRGPIDFCRIPTTP